MSMSPTRKVEQVHGQQSKVLYRIISYLQASKTILRHAIHISILLYVYIDYLNFLSSKLSITLFFSNIIFYFMCLYELPVICNFCNVMWSTTQYTTVKSIMISLYTSSLQHYTLQQVVSIQRLVDICWRTEPSSGQITLASHRACWLGNQTSAVCFRKYDLRP